MNWIKLHEHTAKSISRKPGFPGSTWTWKHTMTWAWEQFGTHTSVFSDGTGWTRWTSGAADRRREVARRVLSFPDPFNTTTPNTFRYRYVKHTHTLRHTNIFLPILRWSVWEVAASLPVCGRKTEEWIQECVCALLQLGCTCPSPLLLDCIWAGESLLVSCTGFHGKHII